MWQKGLASTYVVDLCFEFMAQDVVWGISGDMNGMGTTLVDELSSRLSESSLRTRATIDCAE